MMASGFSDPSKQWLKPNPSRFGRSQGNFTRNKVVLQATAGHNEDQSTIVDEEIKKPLPDDPLIEELAQECIKEKMEEIVKAADIAKSFDENPEDYWKAQVLLNKDHKEGSEQEGDESAEHVEKPTDPKPIKLDSTV